MTGGWIITTRKLGWLVWCATACAPSGVCMDVTGLTERGAERKLHRTLRGMA